LKKPTNPKERNLIKGAIRRVFSRSDLRRSIIDLSRTNYLDPERPRVKKWSICTTCMTKVPTYLMECDHIRPIVPIDSRLEDMSWDAVVSAVWCDPMNLVAICKPCHKIKSKQEMKDRREAKKCRK